MKSTLVSNAWVEVATLEGSTTYNPPAIAAGARISTTVTVTGAVLGDTVACSFSLDTQGIDIRARVSSANTVTVDLWNPTAASIDLASGTLKARVV